MPDRKLSDLPLIRLPASGHSLWYEVEGGQSRQVSGQGIAAMINSGYFLNNSSYFRILSGNWTITGNYSIEVMNGTGFFRTIVGGNKLTNFLPDPASYSSILAGDSNVITSTNSIIAGGSSQRVEAGSSAILAGLSNLIGDAANYSTLCGGVNNKLFGLNGFIGGGNDVKVSGAFAAAVAGDNSIASGDYSFCGAGSNNFSIGPYSACIGGSDNRSIGDSAGVLCGAFNGAIGDDSVCVAGTFNTGHSAFTSCLGGSLNFVSGQWSTVVAGRRGKTISDYSCILGGLDVCNSGTASVAVGGANQRISGNYAAGLGGQQCDVTGDHSINLGGFQTTGRGNAIFLGGGSRNQIGPLKSEYAVLLGGNSNRVTGSWATLCGGNSNLMTSSGGFIGGGKNHSINDNFGVIVGGDTNYASGYSAVVNGLNQVANGQFSFLGNGNANKSALSYGFIGNGASCVVSGTNAGILNSNASQVLANYSCINAGSTNKILYSNYSEIGAGESNSITGGNYNSINGGKTNQILASVYSSIPGGYNNTIDKNTESCFAFGWNNTINGTSGIAMGGNGVIRAADKGSMIFSDYVSKTKTTFDSHACNFWFQSGVRMSGTPLILDENASRIPSSATDTRGIPGQIEVDISNGVWVRAKADQGAGVVWKLLPFATAAGTITADLEKYTTTATSDYELTDTWAQVVFPGAPDENCDILIPSAGTYIVTATVALNLEPAGAGTQISVRLNGTTQGVIADSTRTYRLSIESSGAVIGYNGRNMLVIRAKVTTVGAETIELQGVIDINTGGTTTIVYDQTTLDYLKIAS